MSSPNTTSGLRLSGRYTSARNVVISKLSAVAHRADGSEALALQPQVLGPAVEHRFDRVGTGVGCEVDVAPVELTSGDGVAQPAADEVERVTRVGEAGRELLSGASSARYGARREGSGAVTP